MGAPLSIDPLLPATSSHCSTREKFLRELLATHTGESAGRWHGESSFPDWRWERTKTGRQKLPLSQWGYELWLNTEEWGSIHADLFSLLYSIKMPPNTIKHRFPVYISSWYCAATQSERKVHCSWPYTSFLSMVIGNRAIKIKNVKNEVY